MEAITPSPSGKHKSNEASIRWVFFGNLIQPTGNPFAPEQQQACDSRQEDSNDDTVLWLGPGLKILLDHVLTVNHDGIIHSVEPRRASTLDVATLTADCEIIQLKDPYEFLCPGMIDLHIHAPQFAYTGTATDRPLMGPDGWLETYTFPAERRLRDDLKLAQSVYESVVETTLRHGTTTAVYFATLHVDPCRLLVDVALQKGQRALIGKVCMDRNSPDNYCQSTEQNILETKELIQYIYDRAGKRFDKATRSSAHHHHLPLVLPLVTPRFIPTCTPELLSALGKLAYEEGCHITSHISESLDQVEFSRHLALQDYDCSRREVGGDSGDNDSETTDATVFHSHHLLTDQCIMAHGVWLSDKDLSLLQQHGTAVAHCPLSNFFFADWILPCRALLARGNLVGLGTDVAGGYSPSLLNASRSAVVASRALGQQQQQQQQQQQHAKDDHRLDYRHAFYLATLGGAEALNLQDQLGNFTVGKQMDAFVFSGIPTRRASNLCFWEESLADIFQKLCNLGDDRNITRVFVAGRDVTILSLLSNNNKLL